MIRVETDKERAEHGEDESKNDNKILWKDDWKKLRSEKKQPIFAQNYAYNRNNDGSKLHDVSISTVKLQIKVNVAKERCSLSLSLLHNTAAAADDEEDEC